MKKISTKKLKTMKKMLHKYQTQDGVTITLEDILHLGYLSEFWCCDTNTFLSPWGRVTITLEDILHLGYLSVLGCSISTPCDNECVNVYKCLRSEIKQVKFASGGSVITSMCMKYFMNSCKDVEHEAYLVFWLS